MLCFALRRHEESPKNHAETKKLKRLGGQDGHHSAVFTQTVWAWLPNWLHDANPIHISADPISGRAW